MKNYRVFANVKPRPHPHELSAANLLAKYFQEDVYFLPISEHRTPDVSIGKVHWKIKSPTGTGKHNISHQLRNGVGQSVNLVLDMRRSKMYMDKAMAKAQRLFDENHTIRRLIVLCKNGSVVELKKRKLRRRGR